MGLKTECKKKMAIGTEVCMYKNGLEFKGAIESNSLVNMDHNNVDSDACVILRNDREKVRYIIGIGSQSGFVAAVPFKKKEEEEKPAFTESEENVLEEEVEAAG